MIAKPKWSPHIERVNVQYAGPFFLLTHLH